MAKKLGYIHIEGWMREELDLKGNELLVYALIHGFSQEEQGCFFGSLDYISRMCGCTRPTAIETLKKLRERGLIHKREIVENNVKMCQYTALQRGSKEILPPVKNLDRGGKEILLGGSKEILPNNKEEDNKSIIKDKDPAPLILPFSSDKFRMTWEALCEEKEWKKKTRNALQLTLNKLAKYHEDFAIELMEATIESGKWQRVVFPDTDAKYQEWKSARQLAEDNRQARTTPSQGKPKPVNPNNQVDSFYRDKQRKEEEERARLIADLKAKHGVTDNDNADGSSGKRNDV
jgi:hypothetical protein